MADGIYTFDERGMQAIVAMVREWQRRVTSLERQLMTRHEANYKPAQVFIAKTGGSGIPAASGDVPGSATVTLYRMPSSTLEAAVYTETVYNKNTTAIAANAYIEVVEEALTNKFFAVPEGGSGGDFTLGYVTGSTISGSNASAAALSSGSVALYGLTAGVPSTLSTTVTAYNLTSFSVAVGTEVKVYKSSLASNIYFFEPTFRTSYSATYPTKPFASWQITSNLVDGTTISMLSDSAVPEAYSQPGLIDDAPDDEGIIVLIGGMYVIELHLEIGPGETTFDVSTMDKRVVSVTPPASLVALNYVLPIGGHVLRYVTDGPIAANTQLNWTLDRLQTSESYTLGGFGYIWPMFN